MKPRIKRKVTTTNSMPPRGPKGLQASNVRFSTGTTDHVHWRLMMINFTIVVSGVITQLNSVQSTQSLKGITKDAIEMSNNSTSTFDDQLGPQSYGSSWSSLWDNLTASFPISAQAMSDDSVPSAGNNITSLSERSFVNCGGSIDQSRSTNATNESNCSTQQEQSPQQDDEDFSVIPRCAMVNVFIFLIGFCGNFLVILVILKFTRTETVTDIYILNLAIADIMFLFGLVFLIITMFVKRWIFGNFMCKLYMSTTSLNQFASSLLLVVMGFDRYLAVCHPIYAQRFRQIQRAKVMCLCIWITCLILMTPIFAFSKADYSNDTITCAILWPDGVVFNYEVAFTMYSFAIGFAFPLLLIAGFYLCVIRKLRNAASGQANLGSTRMKSRQNANKRIEYLVTGIICTYTICWLPYWITQLVVSFLTTFRKEPIEGFWQFTIIATSLSYTNSALNPILYAFLSDQFKRRCIEVFGTFLRTTGWYNLRSPTANANITLATAAMCEPSEVKIRCGSGSNPTKNKVETSNNNESNNTNTNNTSNTNHSRPESRQTMTINESMSLVMSRNQQADNLTANTSERLNSDCEHDSDGVGNDCNGRVCNHHSSASGDNGQDQEDTRRGRVIGGGCPGLTRAQKSLSPDNHFATTDGRGTTLTMTSWSTTSGDKQPYSSDFGQHMVNNSAHSPAQPTGMMGRPRSDFDRNGKSGEGSPPGGALDYAQNKGKGLSSPYGVDMIVVQSSKSRGVASSEIPFKGDHPRNKVQVQVSDGKFTRFQEPLNGSSGGASL